MVFDIQLKESPFLKWLSQGSTQLEFKSKTTIEKSMTVNILTMIDGRTITIAEDALVSFDGYYETFTRNSEVFRVIKELKSQAYSL